MHRNIKILRGPVGPLMMDVNRIADDMQIIVNALIEAKNLMDCGLIGEANRAVSIALRAIGDS